MEKKSNERKKNLSATKKNSSPGKTAATRKPGKTGATGIIKKTDMTERPGRTGKTGATGIIRETGKNGMAGMPSAGSSAGTSDKKLVTSGLRPAAKGGKKRVPVILITNDDGISAPGIR